MSCSEKNTIPNANELKCPILCDVSGRKCMGQKSIKLVATSEKFLFLNYSVNLILLSHKARMKNEGFIFSLRSWILYGGWDHRSSVVAGIMDFM